MPTEIKKQLNHRITPKAINHFDKAYNRIEFLALTQKVPVTKSKFLEALVTNYSKSITLQDLK